MSDELPRHLLVALSQAQAAFTKRDRRHFGTINEHLQPVADAALGWIRDLERELATAKVRIQALEAHLGGGSVSSGPQVDPASSPAGFSWFRVTDAGALALLWPGGLTTGVTIEPRWDGWDIHGLLPSGERLFSVTPEGALPQIREKFGVDVPDLPVDPNPRIRS